MYTHALAKVFTLARTRASPVHCCMTTASVSVGAAVNAYMLKVILEEVPPAPLPFCAAATRTPARMHTHHHCSRPLAAHKCRTKGAEGRACLAHQRRFRGRSWAGPHKFSPTLARVGSGTVWTARIRTGVPWCPPSSAPHTYGLRSGARRMMAYFTTSTSSRRRRSTRPVLSTPPSCAHMTCGTCLRVARVTRGVRAVPTRPVREAWRAECPRLYDAFARAAA
jgi:hypothetical protein